MGRCTARTVVGTRETRHKSWCRDASGGRSRSARARARARAATIDYAFPEFAVPCRAVPWPLVAVRREEAASARERFGRGPPPPEVFRSKDESYVTAIE